MTFWFRHPLACLLALGVSAALSVSQSFPAPTADFPAADRYETMFDQFRKMVPRGDRVAAVHNLTLRRDVISFELVDGSLTEATTVGGRTVGLVFVGRGLVSFRPEPPIEQAEISRVLGDSLINIPISTATFFFTDSTSTELARRVTFASGTVSPGAAQAVQEAVRRLTDDGAQLVSEPTLTSDLLNGYAGGLFYAHVNRANGEDLMFIVDPRQNEQIELMRRGRRLGQQRQIVAQFKATPATPADADFTLDHYGIEATVAGGLGFRATATTQLTARRDGLHWVRLLLFDELRVDSVVTGSAAATYFRAPRGEELWVRFDSAVRAGQPQAIRIAYHGNLIGYTSVVDNFMRNLPDSLRHRLSLSRDQWTFVKESQTWFPRFAPADPRYADLPGARVELTFHTPKRYHLASVGHLVSSQLDGDLRTTRWVADRPASQVCFNLGEFQEFLITDPRIPPVTVQINASAHHMLDQLWLGQRDPQLDVGHDVANSLAYFTQQYGPPLYDHYYATEIPFFYGQAFPGLMYLSMETFQTVDESGHEEAFRAHEMAHQWWGIGVEPAGYRDAWLSEGFAEFAALSYMHARLNDHEKFRKRLKEWREAIRERRNDAPPLGLGWRVGQTGAPGDYALVNYRKGAWVLHMLEVLLRNLHTMSDSVFNATMQDFYYRYYGQHASVADFQRVVEEHVGQTMAWFFDEWVNGTAMPTYVFAWRTDPDSDGHFLLHVRVRQKDVSSRFLMPVPLEIDFADSSKAFVRVNVTGPVTEGTLRVPAHPVRLELNPGESVLADVKTERY
jgi:hypothetical protein